MANKMLFDDTRALRREQREARLARKRERHEARALKRQHQTIGLETLAFEIPVVRESRIGEPASGPDPDPVELTPAPVATRPPAVPAITPEHSEQASEPTPTDPVDHRHVPPRTPSRRAETTTGRRPRRERDVAEFRERRSRHVSEARKRAREEIAGSGEAQAVFHALAKLAHPEAFPWQRHRERLAEAIATRRIPDIGTAARQGCRGAAADAARTSRRAPDTQTALRVAAAYAVIAEAPWAAIKGRRAERSSPTPAPSACHSGAS